jgi:hypothetical protein
MLLAVLPRWADAHTLDEVFQGAYLTLAPGEVRLELDVTAGINVAEAVLRVLDADADRTITEAEAEEYARYVLAHSTLSLDGVAVSWRLDRVIVPAYANLELGSDTIKIHAVAERSDTPGEHAVAYRNSYTPPEARPTANVFLRPGEGWDYRITRQQRGDDGRELIVTYTVSRQ